jgi:radical SAM protein with 4Fe4S-binding SPASM domain
VNGGDPTMMPVQYYWDLIKHLEENNYPTRISFTTNLWKFWHEWQDEKREKKWTELFRHPRVGVGTSFQYGDGRQITPARVFKEEDFIKICDLMLEKVGYKPSFIAVIEKKDLETAIENVRLAKRLGIDCKLNFVNKSGVCEKPLPLSYIYKVYLQIFNEGLADHEHNTRQMMNRIAKTNKTICPLHRTCDEGIRVLQPDGKYFSCGSFGDDLEYEIDFDEEVRKGKFFTPLQDDPNIDALKTECYSCPMFQICNGCRKHIKDLKTTNMVEEHCANMQLISEDILKLNFEGPGIEVFNAQYYEK